MAENVYCNSLSDSRLTSEDKNERNFSKPVQQLSILLFLSLLTNGLLAYLCYTKNPNPQCGQRTICSNSDSRLDATPIIKLNSINIKNHSLPSYCSDLKEKWFHNKGRFYVFSTDTMDWSDSRRRCQDLDGDLVIINNEDEQKFLSKNVKDVDDYHWIGLSDGQTEGQWLWVDDTTLDNSLSWKDPPDDWKMENPSDGEDCAILKGEKWGDVSCLRKEKRICEIPCSPPQ